VFDKPSVQNYALSGITQLGKFNKVKPWITSVADSVSDIIRPEGEIDEKAIAAIRLRRQKKLDLPNKKTGELVSR
jgi:hypothetical protein